jgi:hypothetical protein
MDKPESLLVADIGSAITKVGLVDYVAGEFRFVAAGTALTTADPPVRDVAVGIRSALRQIEARTERQLLTPEGQLISPERSGGVGVDTFAMVTSAPVPLRVAIVGLSRDLSVASARRAVAGTHATVEATFSLEDTGGRWIPTSPAPSSDGKSAPTILQDPAVLVAEKIATAKPDVIILTGGTDGGATTALLDLANLVAAICESQEESARPIVIFAGNSEVRSHVADRIGNITSLRVVDNVHPTMTSENLAPLQHELQTLYAERKIAWLPGLNALTNWTGVSIVPTWRAFENTVRFLSRRYGLNVLGADIGAVSTVLIRAQGDSFSHTIRSDLGIGQSLERVIAQAGIDRLMNWLPLEISPDEARTFWLNHTLRPATIPTTREESELMQAAARVALSQATPHLPVEGFDLIVLTSGMFARNTNLGAAALIALDALQPCGVFTLAVDMLGLAPAFGGLAPANPNAAASVIERDGFVTLGTVIAPISKNREGQISLRVKVQPAGSGVMDLEVQHGTLELVPLMPGQKASIEVRTVGKVSLGTHRTGVFKAEIEGGALGLIIDARGRPITLPADADKRRTKVQQWYWDMGGEVAYA